MDDYHRNVFKLQHTDHFFQFICFKTISSKQKAQNPVKKKVRKCIHNIKKLKTTTMYSALYAQSDILSTHTMATAAAAAATVEKHIRIQLKT